MKWSVEQSRQNAMRAWRRKKQLPAGRFRQVSRKRCLLSPGNDDKDRCEYAALSGGCFRRKKELQQKLRGRKRQRPLVLWTSFSLANRAFLFCHPPYWWASLVAQTVKNLPAWRRKWQPTPVFLPGKSHRQMSLVGYSVWHCRVVHNLAAEQQQHTIRQIVIRGTSSWRKCDIKWRGKWPSNMEYRVW